MTYNTSKARIQRLRRRIAPVAAAALAFCSLPASALPAFAKAKIEPVVRSEVKADELPVATKLDELKIRAWLDGQETTIETGNDDDKVKEYYTIDNIAYVKLSALSGKLAKINFNVFDAEGKIAKYDHDLDAATPEIPVYDGEKIFAYSIDNDNHEIESLSFDNAPIKITVKKDELETEVVDWLVAIGTKEQMIAEDHDRELYVLPANPISQKDRESLASRMADDENVPSELITGSSKIDDMDAIIKNSVFWSVQYKTLDGADLLNIPERPVEKREDAEYIVPSRITKLAATTKETCEVSFDGCEGEVRDSAIYVRNAKHKATVTAYKKTEESKAENIESAPTEENKAKSGEQVLEDRTAENSDHDLIKAISADIKIEDTRESFQALLSMPTTASAVLLSTFEDGALASLFETYPSTADMTETTAKADMYIVKGGADTNIGSKVGTVYSYGGVYYVSIDDIKDTFAPYYDLSNYNGEHFFSFSTNGSGGRWFGTDPKAFQDPNTQEIKWYAAVGNSDTVPTESRPTRLYLLPGNLKDDGTYYSHGWNTENDNVNRRSNFIPTTFEDPNNILNNNPGTIYLMGGKGSATFDTSKKLLINYVSSTGATDPTVSATFANDNKYNITVTGTTASTSAIVLAVAEDTSVITKDSFTPVTNPNNTPKLQMNLNGTTTQMGAAITTNIYSRPEAGNPSNTLYYVPLSEITSRIGNEYYDFSDYNGERLFSFVTAKYTAGSTSMWFAKPPLEVFDGTTGKSEWYIVCGGGGNRVCEFLEFFPGNLKEDGTYYNTAGNPTAATAATIYARSNFVKTTFNDLDGAIASQEPASPCYFLNGKGTVQFSTDEDIAFELNSVTNATDAALAVTDNGNNNYSFTLSNVGGTTKDLIIDISSKIPVPPGMVSKDDLTPLTGRTINLNIRKGATEAAATDTTLVSNFSKIYSYNNCYYFPISAVVDTYAPYYDLSDYAGEKIFSFNAVKDGGRWLGTAPIQVFDQATGESEWYVACGNNGTLYANTVLLPGNMKPNTEPVEYYADDNTGNKGWIPNNPTWATQYNAIGSRSTCTPVVFSDPGSRVSGTLPEIYVMKMDGDQVTFKATLPSGKDIDFELTGPEGATMAYTKNGDEYTFTVTGARSDIQILIEEPALPPFTPVTVTDPNGGVAPVARINGRDLSLSYPDRLMNLYRDPSTGQYYAALSDLIEFSETHTASLPSLSELGLSADSYHGEKIFAWMAETSTGYYFGSEAKRTTDGWMIPVGSELADPTTTAVYTEYFPGNNLGGGKYIVSSYVEATKASKLYEASTFWSVEFQENPYSSSTVYSSESAIPAKQYVLGSNPTIKVPKSAFAAGLSISDLKFEVSRNATGATATESGNEVTIALKGIDYTKQSGVMISPIRHADTMVSVRIYDILPDGSAYMSGTPEEEYFEVSFPYGETFAQHVDIMHQDGEPMADCTWYIFDEFKNKLEYNISTPVTQDISIYTYSYKFDASALPGFYLEQVREDHPISLPDEYLPYNYFDRETGVPVDDLDALIANGIDRSTSIVQTELDGFTMVQSEYDFYIALGQKFSNQTVTWTKTGPLMTRAYARVIDGVTHYYVLWGDVKKQLSQYNIDWWEYDGSKVLAYGTAAPPTRTDISDESIQIMEDTEIWMIEVGTSSTGKLFFLPNNQDHSEDSYLPDEYNDGTDWYVESTTANLTGDVIKRANALYPVAIKDPDHLCPGAPDETIYVFSFRAQTFDLPHIDGVNWLAQRGYGKVEYDPLTGQDRMTMSEVYLPPYVEPVKNGTVEAINNRALSIQIDMFNYLMQDSPTGQTGMWGPDAMVNHLDENPGYKLYRSVTTSWTGQGGELTPGMFADHLGEDGLPLLAAYDYFACGGSTIPVEPNIPLGWLFPSESTAYVDVYNDTVGLLQRDPDTGMLYYDSDINYARLNEETREFTLYEEPSHTIVGTQGPHDGEGETRIKTGILDNRFVGYTPFNDFDAPDERAVKYSFGMRISTDFHINAERKYLGEDMTFRFTGDDDVWIFIDGQLLVDLGGVHEEAGTVINFTDGTFEIITNPRTGEVVSGPYDIPESMLTEGQHTFEMYYFERGATLSNLALEFNLMTAIPLALKKYDALDDSQTLPGATFNVYQDTAGLVPILDDNNQPLTTIDHGDGTYSFSYASSRLDGAYLIETSPPDGYMRDATVWKLIYSDDENVYYLEATPYDNTHPGEKTMRVNTEAALVPESGVIPYSDMQKIESPKLPAAGEPGYFLMILLACGLIVAGIMICDEDSAFMKRSRRRRTGK